MFAVSSRWNGWYGYCIEKRRRICGQERDGDGGAGEKNERKTEVYVLCGWIKSRTTCQRESC